MQRIGSPLRVELAGAYPAPVAGAARAVHVVAAVGLVGDNTALRAFLAVFLDSRRRRFLNCCMAAHPICAGLAWMRVAVGETVAGTGRQRRCTARAGRDVHVGAAGARHTRLAGFALLHVAAFAARTEQRVFPCSLESQKFCKSLRRNAFMDKVIRHRVAAVVAANKSVAVVDSNTKILAHAIAAAVEQAARHHLDVVGGHAVVAVRALHEAVGHDACHFSGCCARGV